MDRNDPWDVDPGEKCQKIFDDTTRPDVSKKENDQKATNLVHHCEKYWFLLHVIGLRPTIWIDSHSHGLADRIGSLSGGCKKRGFQRGHVLQFSVTVSGSSKDIGTW